MTKISEEYRDKARKRLLESADVKKRVVEECMESILAATQLIVDTFESDGKVMICGNGGSAADAQHMAGEFVCSLNKSFNRPGLPALALTTDTSILTAQANDVHFDKVFERQVQTLGKPNDLLIAISTSGNSQNIINALSIAKQKKLVTLALTGNKGKIIKMTNITISVPSNNTQYIQESLLVIEHILCELVEQSLFGKKMGKK